MRIEIIKKYEDKLFGFINKYQKTFNKVIDTFDLVAIKFMDLIESLIFSLATVFGSMGKIMRYSTFPFHWIWIKYDIWNYRNKKDDIKDLPIFQVGAHYIYGLPAAGKSTLIYHAMMDYAYLTGKTSYTTQPFELPRKDVFGREYYYHQYWRPDETFIDGEQKFAFDTDRHNVVVYEEMLGDYHQRNNNKSSHNDQILPLAASMGGQRHQGKGLDLFYFISQLPSNDISIMQLLKGYHIPKIVKGFDYRLWLQTGKYRWGIKGWKIESYNILPTGRHDYKLVNKNKWFYQFKYEEDFKYFNQKNLAGKYQELTKLKAREMKA